MRLRMLVVVCLILITPLCSKSLRTGGHSSPFICAAQDCPGGGHVGPGGSCQPPPPTMARPAPENPNRHSSPQVHLPGDSTDGGSGLVTGLMALGTALLFWFRMR